MHVHFSFCKIFIPLAYGLNIFTKIDALSLINVIFFFATCSLKVIDNELHLSKNFLFVSSISLSLNFLVLIARISFKSFAIKNELSCQFMRKYYIYGLTNLPSISYQSIITYYSPEGLLICLLFIHLNYEYFFRRKKLLSDPSSAYKLKHQISSLNFQKYTILAVFMILCFISSQKLTIFAYLYLFLTIVSSIIICWRHSINLFAFKLIKILIMLILFIHFVSIYLYQIFPDIFNKSIIKFFGLRIFVHERNCFDFGITRLNTASYLEVIPPLLCLVCFCLLKLIDRDKAFVLQPEKFDTSECPFCYTDRDFLSSLLNAMEENSYICFFLVSLVVSTAYFSYLNIFFIFISFFYAIGFMKISSIMKKIFPIFAAIGFFEVNVQYLLFFVKFFKKSKSLEIEEYLLLNSGSEIVPYKYLLYLYFYLPIYLHKRKERMKKNMIFGHFCVQNDSKMFKFIMILTKYICQHTWRLICILLLYFTVITSKFSVYQLFYQSLISTYAISYLLLKKIRPRISTLFWTLILIYSYFLFLVLILDRVNREGKRWKFDPANLDRIMSFLNIDYETDKMIVKLRYLIGVVGIKMIWFDSSINFIETYKISTSVDPVKEGRMRIANKILKGYHIKKLLDERILLKFAGAIKNMIVPHMMKILHIASVLIIAWHISLISYLMLILFLITNIKRRYQTIFVHLMCIWSSFTPLAYMVNRLMKFSENCRADVLANPSNFTTNSNSTSIIQGPYLSWIGIKDTEGYKSSLFVCMTVLMSSIAYSNQDRQAAEIKFETIEQQAKNLLDAFSAQSLNHFSRKFGVEVCSVLMMICALLRMDVIGLFYFSIVTLIANTRRTMNVNLWIILTGLIYFLIVANFGINLGFPCYKMPWNIKIYSDEFSEFLRIKNSKPESYKLILYLELMLSIALSKTLKHTRAEWDVLREATCFNLVPRTIEEDFINNKPSLLDTIKYYLFIFSQWVSLVSIFFAPVYTNGLFGFIFSFIALMFIHQIGPILRQERVVQAKLWNVLINFSIMVLFAAYSVKFLSIFDFNLARNLNTVLVYLINGNAGDYDQSIWLYVFYLAISLFMRRLTTFNQFNIVTFDAIIKNQFKERVKSTMPLRLLTKILKENDWHINKMKEFHQKLNRIIEREKKCKMKNQNKSSLYNIYAVDDAFCKYDDQYDLDEPIIPNPETDALRRKYVKDLTNSASTSSKLTEKTDLETLDPSKIYSKASEEINLSTATDSEKSVHLIISAITSLYYSIITSLNLFFNNILTKLLEFENKKYTWNNTLLENEFFEIKNKLITYVNSIEHRNETLLTMYHHKIPYIWFLHPVGTSDWAIKAIQKKHFRNQNKLKINFPKLGLFKLCKLRNIDDGSISLDSRKESFSNKLNIALETLSLSDSRTEEEDASLPKDDASKAKDDASIARDDSSDVKDDASGAREDASVARDDSTKAKDDLGLDTNVNNEKVSLVLFKREFCQEFFSRLLYIFQDEIIKNIRYICLIIMLALTLRHHSILYLYYPFSYFLWGIFTLPELNKVYWLCTIRYTLFVIVVRMFVNIEYFEFNDPGAIDYPEDPSWFPNILGIAKYDSNFHEFILLFTLYINRFQMHRDGIWIRMHVYFKELTDIIKEKGIEELSEAFKVVSKQSNITDLLLEEKAEIDFVEGNDNKVFTDLKNYYSSEIKKRNLKKSIYEFFTGMTNSSVNQFVDYNTQIMFLEFFSFFILLLYFEAFDMKCEVPGGVLLDMIKTNKIPSIFLFTCFGQFVLIIIERICYVQENIRLKIYILYFQVIYIHIWLFFYAPVNTQVPFHRNRVSIVLYLSKLVYFHLSAKQIKSGYPMCIRKVFITWYPNVIQLNTIYSSIPFIKDIRMLIDHMFGDTCLVLKHWNYLEDIYMAMYRRFLYYRLEFKSPHFSGRPRKYKQKLTTFLIYFLMLNITIWLPMFAFWLVDTRATANIPDSCTVSVGMDNFGVLFQSHATIDKDDLLSSDEYHKLIKCHEDDVHLSKVFRRYTENEILHVHLQQSPFYNPLNSIRSVPDIGCDSNLESFLGYSIHFEIECKRNSGSLTGGKSRNLKMKETCQIFDYVNPKSDKTATHFPDIFPIAMIEEHNYNFHFHTGKGHVQNDNTATGLHIEKFDEFTWRVYQYFDENDVPPRRICGMRESTLNINSTVVSGPHFLLVVEKLANNEFFRMIQSKGVLGLFMIYIMTVINMMGKMFNSTSMVMWAFDIPYPERIMNLCHEIYLVRSAKFIDLEERLFARLHYIYRSREMMVEWTKLPVYLINAFKIGGECYKKLDENL